MTGKDYFSILYMYVNCKFIPIVSYTQYFSCKYNMHIMYKSVFRHTELKGISLAGFTA